MAKLLVAPLLLVLGCLIAGVYGALHDQVSFTASPDYFFAFKFHQFQIPLHLQNRVGAAIVGFLATWWMGVLIGVPLLTAGLVFPDARSYARHCLMAYAVVAVTALVFGLGALAVASFKINAHNLPPFHYPAGVQDPVAFARVGVMHNVSYLGGFLGILTGLSYLAIARRRQLKLASSQGLPQSVQRASDVVSHK
jgi:hypothetical protein